MDILQICSAREIGGGERHLVDLTNCLIERGHVVYVGLVPDSPLKGEFPSLAKNHILELRMRNSLHLSSGLKLARIAREHAIDIIHAHLARDYPLAALASSCAGNTPYVLTRHVLFPLSSVHRLFLRRVSRVIAVSRAVAAALHKQGIFDPNRVVTIPNGIDTTRFAKTPAHQNGLSKRDKSGARFLVGMVGHLSPIKGQEDFVRAAAIIASHRADVDFVLVGEDKSRSRKNRIAIESLIAQLGLGKRVQLVGWLDDVSAFLGTLDVFVSTSRSEPFGLALIEAMASGVPVVATMSEGSREIIDDGVTGRLVAIKDVVGLAKAIDELLTHESERKQLSVNARGFVQQRFSLQRMVDDTEQLYLDVLHNSNSRRLKTSGGAVFENGERENCHTYEVTAPAFGLDPAETASDSKPNFSSPK